MPAGGNLRPASAASSFDSTHVYKNPPVNEITIEIEEDLKFTDVEDNKGLESEDEDIAGYAVSYTHLTLPTIYSV